MCLKPADFGASSVISHCKGERGRTGELVLWSYGPRSCSFRIQLDLFFLFYFFTWTSYLTNEWKIGLNWCAGLRPHYFPAGLLFGLFFSLLTGCPILGKEICFSPAARPGEGAARIVLVCACGCPQEAPLGGEAQNGEGDCRWISGFLLSNCLLMIWLPVSLPISCPLQQNRPRESGTSSQQDTVVYKTEIHNLMILQARFSADVKKHLLWSESLYSDGLQVRALLSAHIDGRKELLSMQYYKGREVPQSHRVVSLHAMVSQSSELIWRNAIRESVIAAKGSVIHHLLNKGSQHWKMHELFWVFGATGAVDRSSSYPSPPPSLPSQVCCSGLWAELSAEILPPFLQSCTGFPAVMYWWRADGVLLTEPPV